MRAETQGDETPAVVSFLLDENLNDDIPEGKGDWGARPPLSFRSPQYRAIDGHATWRHGLQLSKALLSWQRGVQPSLPCSFGSPGDWLERLAAAFSYGTRRSSVKAFVP